MQGFGVDVYYIFKAESTLWFVAVTGECEVTAEGGLF